MNRARNIQLLLRASPHSQLYAGMLCASLCVNVAACNGNPAEPDGMVDSGSWYVTGFRWSHDGNPYESAHFVIYSDAASDEARRTLAEIAEEVLSYLNVQFDLNGQELFRFPPGQEKIHIYTYKDHCPMEWGGGGTMEGC